MTAPFRPMPATPPGVAGGAGVSCANCGSRPPRAGIDVLGFLSGPHALHHAVAVTRIDNDARRARNCDDGMLFLTCCCGGDVEVSIRNDLVVEDDEGEHRMQDVLRQLKELRAELDDLRARAEEEE